MVTLSVVTLWVVGILDVSGSLLAFWLLMFLGFVELVVDAVVGSLVVTRGVLLAVAIVFFWAEVGTGLVTDILGMSTPVGIAVTVDVTMDVTVDVGVAFCATAVGRVVFWNSFWRVVLTLGVFPFVFSVAFPMNKDNTESIGY